MPLEYREGLAPDAPAFERLRTLILMLFSTHRFWLILIAGLAAWFSVGALHAEENRKPNVIVVNLDDADYAMLSDGRSRTRFPHLTQMASEGLRFSNVHAVVPLCGPSRACLLRGQYAHNTLVKVNAASPDRSNGFDGGMRFYRDRGYFDDDISVWMKNAGYRTMMVGKFLHSDFVRTVPPGWDDFYFYLGGKYYDFYRFSNLDPGGRFEKFPPALYRTVAETFNALELIESQVARDAEQPFFLLLQPLGPHRHQKQSIGMIDFGKYENAFPFARVRRTAAFDESDFSDKRGRSAELSRLSLEEMEFVDEHYRDRVIATKSVDDMIGDIVSKLEELGIADETYIFVTSDNGYSLGHNRWVGKGGHFLTSSRVPLIARGPNVASGRRVDHLVAQIDLVPTILQIAGVELPEFLDGKSFLPLLENPGSVAPEAWQPGILIENWESFPTFGKNILTASNTLRTFDAAYTEHANGDKEFYDLSKDPTQLNNIYDQLTPFEQSLISLHLKSLKNPEHPAIARFSNPSEDFLSFDGGVLLRGLAEDANGVDRVNLAIQDPGTGKFWNGLDWQPGFRQLRAGLANRGGNLSEWQYLFQPLETRVPSGPVAVWAWAYDANGRFGEPQRRVFQLAASGPLVQVQHPAVSDILTTPVVCRGEAVASAGIEKVRLSIRDLETEQFWNGHAFVDERTYFNLVVEATGEWKLPLNLPSGDYRLTVQSQALDGVNSEEARVLFSVVAAE